MELCRGGPSFVVVSSLQRGPQPGALFAGWRVVAGLGRGVTEFLRPAPPKLPELGISYSSIFAALMAIAGAVMLMARYKAIHLKIAEDWEEEYKRSSPVDQLGGKAEAKEELEEVVEEKKIPRARKASAVKAAA